MKHPPLNSIYIFERKNSKRVKKKIPEKLNLHAASLSNFPFPSKSLVNDLLFLCPAKNRIRNFFYFHSQKFQLWLFEFVHALWKFSIENSRTVHRVWWRHKRIYYASGSVCLRIRKWKNISNTVVALMIKTGFLLTKKENGSR